MKVIVTAHAFDRASQRLILHWFRECPDREPGLFTWLQARAQKVADGHARLVRGQRGDFKVKIAGVEWVFATGKGADVLMLKTVRT